MRLSIFLTSLLDFSPIAPFRTKRWASLSFIDPAELLLPEEVEHERIVNPNLISSSPPRPGPPACPGAPYSPAIPPLPPFPGSDVIETKSEEVSSLLTMTSILFPPRPPFPPSPPSPGDPPRPAFPPSLFSAQ